MAHPLIATHSVHGGDRALAHEDIMAVVVESICEETKCADPDQITIATTAREVPGWDSLAHVRIMLGIEMELDIEVPIDITYRAETVGELIQLIENVVTSN